MSPGKAVFWFIVAVVAAVLLSVGIWGATVAIADIFGRGEAHKELHSAPYRIAAYDHFHDLCVSVQDAESSLDAQFDLLTTAQDKSIVQTNIAALKAVRMHGINQYNEDAKKNYTLGQFRDSDLPWQLPATPYDKKGTHTTCSAA